MEVKFKKCSSKKHYKINAISYCKECKIYLCNKCLNMHLELFEYHHLNTLDEKKSDEIFNGYCKVSNHFQKLEYFCQNHNKLCCAACIAKIKTNGYGQHTDCNVCIVQDIQEEKQKLLQDNIKYLENLYLDLTQLITELKNSLEKMNKNKELFKLKIKDIFDNIRKTINQREKELYIELDNKYNEIYGNEDFIKDSKRLPSKIRHSIEKGKILDNEWNDNNKLIFLINDCLNIENNIEKISLINERVKKCNYNKNLDIKFLPEENGINEFIASIQNFGQIFFNNFPYKIRPMPKERECSVTGEKENIFTKLGKNPYWLSAVCDLELYRNNEYKWVIKILKSQSKSIMVGVAPNDFNIVSSTYNNCGWYLFCSYSKLFSGPPQNYNNKTTNLGKVKDEVVLVLDTKNGTLKFIINGKDDGPSYTNIPLDKPLLPVVFLYNENDSVEIDEYKEEEKKNE